jgi:hypothetical protein
MRLKKKGFLKKDLYKDEVDLLNVSKLSYRELANLVLLEIKNGNGRFRVGKRGVDAKELAFYLNIPLNKAYVVKYAVDKALKGNIG